MAFTELPSAGAIPGVVTAIALRDGAALPDWAGTRLEAAMSRPGSEGLVGMMEALYAAGESLSEASWLGLARIAHKIAAHGFGDVGKNGRAVAIYRTALRNAGEAEGSDTSEDPEIDAAWGEPVEPETEDAEPEDEGEPA